MREPPRFLLRVINPYGYNLYCIRGKLMKADIRVGYTTIKDFETTGIKSYVEDEKGISIEYKDGSIQKYNGATSAIDVIRIIAQTAIDNFNNGFAKAA